MEALAASVCLRAPGLAAAVIAVLDSAAELGFVALQATKRGATIAPHARPPDAVLGIKWDYLMVEDLGRGDRGLAIIELGKGDLSTRRPIRCQFSVCA